MAPAFAKIDCDLEGGSVRVEKTLVWLDGEKDLRTGKRGRKWEFGEPKTDRSRRTIPLPASVASELRTHRADQAEWKLKLGVAYEDHGLVFASDTGGPVDGQNLAYGTLKPILVDALETSLSVTSPEFRQ